MKELFFFAPGFISRQHGNYRRVSRAFTYQIPQGVGYPERDKEGLRRHAGPEKVRYEYVSREPEDPADRRSQPYNARRFDQVLLIHSLIA